MEVTTSNRPCKRLIQPSIFSRNRPQSMSRRTFCFVVEGVLEFSGNGWTHSFVSCFPAIIFVRVWGVKVSEIETYGEHCLLILGRVLPLLCSISQLRHSTYYTTQTQRVAPIHHKGFATFSIYSSHCINPSNEARQSALSLNQHCRGYIDCRLKMQVNVAGKRCREKMKAKR